MVKGWGSVGEVLRKFWGRIGEEIEKGCETVGEGLGLIWGRVYLNMIGKQNSKQPKPNLN